MAIYHCSIKIISRGKGKSAVAAAAYRAGETITNEYDGITHDYTRKFGVVHTEILLPEHAPGVYTDRAVLWNAVEQIEKNKNAQLAREIELALPVELCRKEQISLVRSYVRDTFVSVGMCADVAVHDKSDGNPHAHIMLTLRPFEQDGTWGAKSRKEYLLDKNGARIRLKSGEFKTRKIDMMDWNEQTKAEEWRAAWADAVNTTLERQGLEERVDHRSFLRQGKEETPTVHMGVAAAQMERKGIPTEKGGSNREIAVQNKLLKEIKARLTCIYNWSKEQTVQPCERRSVLEQLRQTRNVTHTTPIYGRTRARNEGVALFNLLQENGISSIPKLHEKISDMNREYYVLRGEIASAERELAQLNERIVMWEQYLQNRDVYQQFAALKPGARDFFSKKHRVEFILFDSAVSYLDEMKASGEVIEPRKWRAETERLTSHKNSLFQQVKAIRGDIALLEKFRKSAEGIPSGIKSSIKEHDYER